MAAFEPVGEQLQLENPGAGGDEAMTAEDLREDAADGDSAIRQALKKLAGASVSAVITPDGGVDLAVMRNGVSSHCGEISEADWAVLEGRGWVVAEADGTWRLSNAGRIHLKRLLSRGETARAEQQSPLIRSRYQTQTVEMNVAESPLAWLYRRTDRKGQPLISQEQFEAGERLRADFERGHMGPRLTANWSSAGGVSPGSAGPDFEIELRAHAIAARERVRAALAAAGPELSGILIDVCCHLRGLAEVERSSGWPQRTAKVVLLMALTTLARHYGLMTSGEAASNRLRHWGGESYRPEFDANGAG